MQLDNKEIIDYINKEIDDYNGFAKGFHEDIKEWKQSSKSKNKKLDDEEKDFETDTSNQMHIRSIKDFSPYLVHRINKVDGSGKESWRNSYHSVFFIILFLIFVIMIFVCGMRITVIDCVYFFLWAIFFLYEFALIFSVYYPRIHKKKKEFYINIRAHILTYYYDQKKFNGAKWQIDRDTFLNNMKYIGKYNQLAIRLTEIGKNPTSNEYWKFVKLYQRYCFFMDVYCSRLYLKSDKRKIPKITRDPIKSPIKYIQYNMFFPIVLFIVISTLICLINVDVFNDLWPEYIYFSYIFLFFNLIFIIWAIIFVLHLQKDYNKVLSAIKPLFPNDVYDDFVNSPING
ncbi:MAG: hypothetical protein LBC33_00505, partial [Mycoplasmataceae bacterium]|nr:hypothetical protein [Mycoplasmataceae bacterium]